MYHRVAERGPRALDRHRLHPEQFEEQLDFLRDAGFYGISLEDWRRACEARRPLPGQAVLLTFDDGYRDFAETAWPLLERYGFPATVFLVAGRVNGSSTWDSPLGGDAPLLGWDEVRELRDRGVEFGSHTLSHPALRGLSNADVVRELLASKALIEERLGEPVSGIAYPYGDVDAAIAHLAGACGYTYGLTCEPGRAALQCPLLGLPRIEVKGTFCLEQLARALSAHE
jgi:peptidoglycan/xylan/chitin deacetylase (PgdA/CDA1 family)